MTDRELLKKTLASSQFKVYTILRHVSRSGMTRWISLIVFDKKTGELLDISYQAAKILKWSFDINRHAVKVSGCGMDMGFHLVYSLSRELYHQKGKTKDAGYKLKQNWL